MSWQTHKEKKSQQKKANELVPKRKLVTRDQMWSPISALHTQWSYCYWHSPFPSVGLAQAGPWDRHNALPLSPAQLTQSVLAQSRQGTSQPQVSQIKTGLLLAACSILNVCQGWLLVICLPVWDDSLMTFEQQLWPWLVARDTKTCVHDITWWTARCIWRHENSAAY